MVRVIALALVLAGCTTTAGSYCQISKPIRLSVETIDHLSDAEVAAILESNEKGRKICGWHP